MHFSLQGASAMRDFRFTVEQIWLLQRLRGSGLNREQIVAGLEDLDRLDGSCLLNVTGRPHSANSDIVKSNGDNSDSEKTPNSNPSQNQIGAVPNFNASQSVLQKNLSQAAAAILSTQSKLPVQSPFPNLWSGQRPNHLNPYAALGNTFSSGISNGEDQKPVENGFSRKNEEHDDLADELDQIQRAVEFCERRNQHEVKEEIRIFTQRHHISQTAISKATHQAISQSYISQWLTSNITMGDAKRRIIYEWFVRQKRRLEGAYPSATTMPPKTSTTSSLLSLPASLQSRLINHLPSSNGVGAPALPAAASSLDRSSPTTSLANRKPRQRIMWPMRCLQYLDNVYTRNPYPGSLERSKIVEDCNSILGDDRTVEISEAHVANWFRNRRKMKKNIDSCTDKNGVETYEHLVEMSMDGSENGAENDVEISVEEIASNGASLEQKIKIEQSPGSSPAREGISTPDHQAQAPVNISQFSANQMTAQVHTAARRW
ncbi:Oidioi.mRNA.OKI2018_I69.chr2.g4192.t3.cds [Oikopleura dioica]|uniref:Oidioi.mRNA.OKI2018_I69.chr2.g4192.t3.cds n=1 Tax=Oikopleura dioica TaxID=34765 RepID=A0ABN7SW70_OIKDI|nr:Oidioi.mRNA.OKI2018_I69.chr2.g4192.t3.cds [Oikopleura dioica]